MMSGFEEKSIEEGFHPVFDILHWITGEFCKFRFSWFQHLEEETFIPIYRNLHECWKPHIRNRILSRFVTWPAKRDRFPPLIFSHKFCFLILRSFCEHFMQWATKHIDILVKVNRIVPRIILSSWHFYHLNEIWQHHNWAMTDKISCFYSKGRSSEQF